MPQNLIPPSSTLVILLGSEEFPEKPDWNSKSFGASHHLFKRYLEDIGIPEHNFLDLFGSTQNSTATIEEINDFLENAPSNSTDLIMYYVGHGAFTDSLKDYFLAIRATKEATKTSSGLRMDALAHTLKEKALGLRKFLILDCCFAAAAARSYQADPSSIVALAANEAFEGAKIPLDESSSLPERGTALLCASNPDARASHTDTLTRFAEALLFALQRGSSNRSKMGLSIQDVCDLARSYLSQATPQGTEIIAKPSFHCPDQPEGNIATQIGVFPNPNYQPNQPNNPSRTYNSAYDENQQTSPSNKVRYPTVSAASNQPFELRGSSVDKLQKNFLAWLGLERKRTNYAIVLIPIIFSVLLWFLIFREISFFWLLPLLLLSIILFYSFLAFWMFLLRDQSLITLDTISQNNVSMSSDSSRISYTGQDGTTKVYDIKHKKEILFLGKISDSVVKVAFTKNNKALVTLTRNGSIIRWSLDRTEKPNTHALNSSLVFKPGGSYSAVLSPDGNTLVIADDYGLLEVFDTTNGKKINTLDLRRSKPTPPQPTKTQPNEGSDSFEDVFDRIFGGSKASRALYDHNVLRNPYFLFKPKHVVFTRTGEKIVYTVEEELDGNRATHKVYLVDLTNVKSMRLIWEDEFRPESISLGNRKLTYTDIDKNLQILLIVKTETLYGRSYNRVLFDSYYETDILAYDIRNGSNIITFRISENLTCVTLHPNGKYLGTSTEGNNTIGLWEVNTGLKMNTLKGHLGNVKTLFFSKNGRILVSIDNLNTIKLWDVSFLAE